MKLFFKILYWIAIVFCVLVLLASIILAIDCIRAYFTSCVKVDGCSCEVQFGHEKTYLSIIAACFVGFVASLIQLILLIRNKRNISFDQKSKTLCKINDLKNEISKFEFTILKLNDINKLNEMRIAYNYETNLFVISNNINSYLQNIETEFQQSIYGFELIGDENTRQLLNNPKNTQNYKNYIKKLMFLEVQKRIDFIAGKLNAFLGDYYNGLLDEQIFDENKEGIIDYYVSVIMYYSAICYNQNDYNDYVYLIDYIIDNFC